MVSLRITDKQIPLDSALVQKFDLLIHRIERKKPQQDAVVSIEGTEGTGKTTMSCILGYYVHYVTGKPFSEKNVFSETKEALEFAQNTEKQIIVFDEPAIDVMSAEWWKEIQKDLIKLLMLSRKRRHFFIFNITKFYKFPEYIIVDRGNCMIHVYENPKADQFYYAYIGKNCLENLYNDFRKRRERNYRKYTLFTSHFPDVLDPESSYNILDHFNIEEYEKRKDKAILSIGKKMKSGKYESRELKAKMAHLKFPIQSQREFAKKLGIPISTLNDWGKIEETETAEKNQQSQTTSYPITYSNILLKNGRSNKKPLEEPIISKSN